ncbi:amino acid adenylation domain-containing protein [Streptomyces zhaozhouensis]|uniref:Amino acid adenylation domain-containing protein n=1 Tax=Streptomyces zhaozhouensis TaxID=1300267 RepID=A0A286EAT6_9ACTN|nr:amino acid adenylation domain-containing protein [Streptomyces zhaozhouensis]SOD68008.1 amino acid adenylation domain-containing protein [Streptomyces zhaozhouensis]
MRSYDEAIRRHALERPRAPAVVTPGGTLDYGELLARAGRLARRLRARGVGPETVCAVALPHGADAVVAMVAVTGAGGAFLTLDVDAPPPRLAALAASAGATHVLTTSALAGRLVPPLPGSPLLLDGAEPDGPADAPRPAPPRPDALAYVSHTSGSTGTPHAVLVEHRSLTSYLRDSADAFRLGPDSVTLQLAPLGYDASIRDTLTPLVAGGRLVVLPRATLLRAEPFVEAVRAFGVDALLSVTPSFLTFLAGHPGAAEGLASLRLVVSSGESLRPHLGSGGRSLTSGRLVNQYGPTECTMTTTRFEVPHAPDTTADLVGTPVAGARVLLLDGEGAEVPEGAVGEVYIGGVGVARGYRGLPALTAERFVPDPFATGRGARLYRTGDLGRRGPDGVLEYLGRTDRQIKIRGHRVEPAEIEAALLTHPTVAGAAVTAAHDARGRVFLLAHVVGARLVEVTDAALRAHLGRTLPAHMMPRRFVRVDALPTTRGGKVDRAALAAGGGR